MVCIENRPIAITTIGQRAKMTSLLTRKEIKHTSETSILSSSKRTHGHQQINTLEPLLIH